MMHYKISCNRPLSHYVQFELTIDGLLQDKAHLFLPSWRPGRYQIKNFAKNIRGLKVTDTVDEPLPFEKNSKDSWVVELQGKKTIKVVYEYYAHLMDAGSSWLDDEQLYLNFINCCIYEKAQLDHPCTIALELPGHYEIACGLEKSGQHELRSPSYYRLVDSPLMAGSDLRQIHYTCNGTLFTLWIKGHMPQPDDVIIHDFERFTRKQTEVMGAFPCRSYHYLYQCLPYPHYHGVEHWNSTMITIGPSSELGERPLYKEFLGVSSHELFHTWNVIRLRPKEMTPYDFQKENYHKTGFITEGVTTYYGDLLLARSGVFSLEEYLEELNKLLKKHYDNKGRRYISVAESSFDLWLDGYGESAPGRRVSIYNEGALAAMILDLKIRLRWKNKRSLDDVMQLMWDRHGKDGPGYTYQDYKDAAEMIYGEGLTGYFEGIISGTRPYETALKPLLESFGLDFQWVPSKYPGERDLGFRITRQQERYFISQIAPHSPAEQVLAIKDELIAVNGSAFDESLDPAYPLTLEIDRFGRKLTFSLGKGDREYFSVYQVTLQHPLSKTRQSHLQAWLEACVPDV